MNINSFREKKNWSYSELARQVGASHATVVRRWCLPLGHDERLIPAPKYMDRIVKVSEGQVMPNDFYVLDD